MFKVLKEYRHFLLNENMKAAPQKFFFILNRVKFPGHVIERQKIKNEE